MNSTRLRVSVSIAAALATLSLSSGASAGGSLEPSGPVVAHGKSAGGVPWQIRANRPAPGAVNVFFVFDPPAYFDVGYLTGFSLPIPHKFIFTADTGTDLSPSPESDLSGVATRRVRTLRVRMSEGLPLEIHPRLAPLSVRRHFDWLHDLRFFNHFFPAGPEPEVVKALAADGRVLTRVKSIQGLFPAYCTSCH